MRSDMIRLFQTLPHACGYYPDRIARNLVVDPEQPQLATLYELALERGFRRAGDQLYLPHCSACNACTPTRIEVARFLPDRSQRRNLRDNRDLEVSLQPAGYSDERFQLYARYLHARHPDGGMDDPAPEDFPSFLTADWSPTRFLECRLAGELLAVAVTDLCANGLSAVYTFYAPEHAHRGLGTLAILQQIELARQRQLAWIYLGFWLPGHPKMDYKRRFRPLQIRDDRGWHEAAPRP
ncbi:arginyltransferase [Frateuria aurantia]